MDLEKNTVVKLVEHIERDLTYNDKKDLIKYLIKVLKKDVESFKIYDNEPKILFQYDILDLNEKELSLVKTYINNRMLRHKK